MKNISYIIKRIVIGVGIALVLTFLRRGFVLNVQAMEVDGYPIGEDVSIIDNTTSSYTKTINGSPWASLAGSYGYINGTFSISKVDGSATSINVTPKQVYVNSGNTSWVCSIGSNNLTNSTFNQATYSYKCPIQMTSSGLSSLVIQFVDIQTNFPSMYRLVIGSLVSFEIHNDSSINIDTSGTTNAINNQITNDNQNTQNIINNQNQNKQDIINNQNQNTEKEIESQKACIDYDISSASFKNKYILNIDGSLVDTTNSSVTDFISLTSNDTLTLIQPPNQYSNFLAFYNVNKSFISSSRTLGMTAGQIISIPQNTAYVRFTINNLQNLPQFKICRNGNQAIVNSQNQINNTLNNDNVDDANTEAGSFFDDFQSNSHGLSGVITSPLRLINSLTTASCSPLEFQLPFIHNQVSLPCMRGIYETHFGVFFSLYQLITTGLISYLVMINLYSKIHNLQNPHNDRIEVLNL